MADDRKGEDEDRDVTCEERLESIIRALEEEKTICEDVMNSACQIRMFVNAPKAYANRKYQNRVGNSKRGKPKDSDAAEPPSKARKLNSKQATRARRSESDVLGEPSAHARLNSRASHLSPLPQSYIGFTTPPPYPVSPEPRAIPSLAPMYSQPHAQQRTYAMSLPARASPLARRVSSIPPQQHTPLRSTATLAHDTHSAPPSPDDAPVSHVSDVDWSSIQRYGNTFYPGDAPLFDESWRWSNRVSEHVFTGADANLFTVHPEAASKVLSPGQQLDGAFASTNSFPEYWEHQHGIQPLPDLQNPYEDKKPGDQRQ